MPHISDAEHGICDAKELAPSMPVHDLNALMLSYGRTQTEAASALLASFAGGNSRTVLSDRSNGRPLPTMCECFATDSCRLTVYFLQLAGFV